MRLFHGNGDKRWVTLLALALALAIAACSLAPNDPGPTATVVPTLPLPTPLPPATELPAAPLPTFVPTPGKAGGVIIGAAHVEEMGLLILESFPVQVNVHVTGWLGDGCTTLDQVTQVRTGNTITVRITTARPTDAICTQQLVGFEKTIALDVAGLPAGTYTVDVNGVTDTFTLSVDNVLP